MSLWLNMEVHVQACTHLSCDLPYISRLLHGLFTIVFSVHCFHPPSQNCLSREETYSTLKMRFYALFPFIWTCFVKALGFIEPVLSCLLSPLQQVQNSELLKS